jgi:hypothetical protein
MSDRNLPEPDRAFEQLMRTFKREIASLRRTVTKTGASSAGECVRTFFDGGTVGDGGFWVEHPMIEFDIDAGSWVLDGELSFELAWNGFNFNAMGYQDAHAIIDWRPIGTSTIAASDRIEFRECPLAYPMNNGVAQNTAWRTTVPVSKLVSSANGLTVRLVGLFTHANGTPAANPGDDFWLGPGVLTATPL